MNYPGYPMYYPIGGHFPAQISDDAGKIFVGGIPADATKESLSDYFSQFGEVSDCIIMVDNMTGRSRGFGFVTFLDQATVNKVVAHTKHVINGKAVDAKRAVPKGPNQRNILNAMGITSNRADRNPDCKVFVGGVAQGTTESDLEGYFKEYGKVLEVKIPKDQNTQRARGFSFVLFDCAESVNNATKERYHRINGKMVEVKTVQVQPNKTTPFDSGGSDDEQIRSPPSPFLLTPRPGFYPSYPQGYMANIGMNAHGFYERYEPSRYEPSPSGSTSSAASLGSTGYGNIPQSGTGQRVDEYSPYNMAPLHYGMSELSINQQYTQQRNRGYPTMHRAQYPVPAGEALSGPYTPPTGPSPSPYHNEISAAYGSSPSPVYAQMSGQVPVPPQYASTSTAQPVASIPTYNR